MKKNIVCLPKTLPSDRLAASAERACAINPANRPSAEKLAAAMKAAPPPRLHAGAPPTTYIAALTSKYWPSSGVRLTVGFLDGPEAALRRRILQHMNAWGAAANVTFVESSRDAQVRISRHDPTDPGHWSYVGTDILDPHILVDQATMNLEQFTMDTEDAEFYRVVRHETGHTLGFVHEHLRRELIDLIDPDKAIEFYFQNYRWDEAKTRAEVLTPAEESSLIGTVHADPGSIMCYQIPASITRNGEPILGGLDIDAQDYAFAASLYPKSYRTNVTPIVSYSPSATSLVSASTNDSAVVSPSAQAPLAPASSPVAAPLGSVGGKSSSSSAVLCFTPGTEPEYIATVVRALEGGRGSLPASAPVKAAAPGGTRVRITLNGFQCAKHTYDDMLERDGKGDEVFFVWDLVSVTAGGSIVHRPGRTPVYGDVNGQPNRVIAGSRSGQGGIQSGDIVPGPLVLAPTPIGGTVLLLPQLRNPWSSLAAPDVRAPSSPPAFPYVVFDEVMAPDDKLCFAPQLIEWDQGNYDAGGSLTVANKLEEAVATTLLTFLFPIGLPLVGPIAAAIDAIADSLGVVGDRPIGASPKSSPPPTPGDFNSQNRGMPWPSLCLRGSEARLIAAMDQGKGPGVFEWAAQDPMNIGGATYYYYVQVSVL